MADSYQTIRLSENRDLEGTLTPATGTETISSATVSIFDNAGAVAGGVSGTTCTGITSGASAAPIAYFTFCANTLTIGVGYYTVVFKITDSNGKIFEPTIGLKVIHDYD